jgi:type IV pilus assembly protein PilA
MRATQQRRHVARRGFTLIELMIVVAIIGILAALAIPTYLRFQMKAKSSEAKVNLAAIRTAEESYYTEHGIYLAATSNPTTIPGVQRATFDASNPGFLDLGWAPEGTVFFSYGIGITPNRTGYSADAGADIDGNGINQYWTFIRANPSGVRAAGVVGCNTAVVGLEEVQPCTPQAGQSVF